MHCEELLRKSDDILRVRVYSRPVQRQHDTKLSSVTRAWR